MGINLNAMFAFKPRRKPTQKQLDALAATACYADVGIRDDGCVYADLADCGRDDSYVDFIQKHAIDYVVVTGDSDNGAFEEVICPPHVVQWRAEVDWRQKEIRRLTNEIVDIVAASIKGG